jgi:hypothetical protein
MGLATGVAEVDLPLVEIGQDEHPELGWLHVLDQINHAHVLVMGKQCVLDHLLIISQLQNVRVEIENLIELVLRHILIPQQVIPDLDHLIIEIDMAVHKGEEHGLESSHQVLVINLLKFDEWLPLKLVEINYLDGFPPILFFILSL